MKPFSCPTKADLLAAALALLPRGRAWQTHETGPSEGIERAFQPDAFQPDAFVTNESPRSVLWQFWAAIAEMLEFVVDRICALRLEFWCATHSETHDWWMQEYGLPDACDPFPDLCTKVSAVGGTRCEYYADVAARAGWTIVCDDGTQQCGARAGCSFAGNARAGGRTSAGTVRVLVFVKESPSFTLPLSEPSLAGRMRAGRRHSCGPDISPLQCLLDRVVHAHITIDYQIVTG